MEKNKLIQKIENGKQVGIRKVINMKNAEFLYTYAIQKINGKYIVYMAEINIDTFYDDEGQPKPDPFSVYDRLEDLLADFDHRHGIVFEDLNVSKGNKFFNSDIIKYRPELIQHKL